MRAGRRWNRNKLLAARTFRSIRCASLRPSPKFRGHDTQLLAFLVWSSWMTRMRMFFLIAVAAVCMLAAWEYLNFTGFCYGQHRYLSDQEMIDAAVLYEINTNARYHVQDVRDNPGWTKKYASIAEFHKENPHCCTVWRWGFPGNYGEGIWVRAFGWYVAWVDLEFRTRDSGQKQFYSASVSVNQCGKVMEDFGSASSVPPQQIK
jgi:hypothetical protein